MVSNELFRIVSLRQSRRTEDDSGAAPPADPRLRHRGVLAGQAQAGPSPKEVRLRELRKKHADLSSRITQLEAVASSAFHAHLLEVRDEHDSLDKATSSARARRPALGERFEKRVLARLGEPETVIFREVLARFPSGEGAEIDGILDGLSVSTTVGEANLVCTEIRALEEDDSETWPTVAPSPAGTDPVVAAVGWGELVVARESLVGYTAREVAHIENVLPGETKLREHSRLSKTESVQESEIITEKESEKDSQTTDRYELQAHSQEAISQEFAVKAGVNTSGRYGITQVDTSLDTAFSQSESQSRSNSVTTAREVVSKAVERTFERVRELRRLTITEELRELNRHELTNASEPARSVSGMYLWVEKIQKIELRQYGTRMMLEFHVPEPALSLLERARSVSKRLELPRFDVAPSAIHPGNYLCLAQRYGAVDVQPPPALFIQVGHGWTSKLNEEDENWGEDSFTALINVPDGYRPLSAKVLWSGLQGKTENGVFDFDFAVGGRTENSGNEGYKDFIGNREMKLSDSADWPHGVPVSGRVRGAWDGAMYVQTALWCMRTADALDKWRLRTWEALRAGHEALSRAVAQEQQQEAYQRSLLGPAIEEGAASENRRIEQIELQKWAIKSLRRVPQNFNAIEQVGEMQEMSTTHAEAQAPIVRFHEDAFEWELMSYFLYPYHWARRASWRTRTAQQAIDPRFRAFLEAGAARVIVPVTPGYEEKVMAYLDPVDPNASELDRVLGAPRATAPAAINPFRDLWVELLTQHKPDLARGSGSLSVTNGSTVVEINADSRWHAGVERDLGRELYISGVRYEVVGVDDDRHLRIDRPYEGITDAATVYVAGSVPFGAPWTVNVPTSLIVLADNVAALEGV